MAASQAVARTSHLESQVSALQQEAEQMQVGGCERGNRGCRAGALGSAVPLQVLPLIHVVCHARTCASVLVRAT